MTAVGGGAPAVVAAGLSAAELDVAGLRALVARDGCGAVVVFEGTTRSPNHGHEVLALEYEAWEERAGAQLAAIAAEVAERHQLGALAVVHRVGTVPVGAVAVAVAAAAPHRDAAFAGAREAIDRVKAEAAIWKKEHRADGAVWVEGC